MRFQLIICFVLGLACAAFGKDPKPYQTGKLQRMDSVVCGNSEKDSSSVAGEMLGADTGTKKTHELLCQEYVLESDMVTYRIRPRDEKHPALLPVGELAQFRLQKDKLLLRLEDLHSKEREYVVVSIAPRSDGSSADASRSRINHLQ